MMRPRALRWPVVRIAARTSIVVGIVLNTINHAEIWLGIWSPGVGWKLALNFVVPYLVATYGAASMSTTMPDERPRTGPAERVAAPRPARPGDEATRGGAPGAQ